MAVRRDGEMCLGIILFGVTGQKNRQREASEHADVSGETGDVVEVPTASTNVKTLERKISFRDG